MSRTDHWLAAYGPRDGAWLREEFERITKNLNDVANVRLARLDDDDALGEYQRRADEGVGMGTDWELMSPFSGVRYMMGCNWRDRRDYTEGKPAHV